MGIDLADSLVANDLMMRQEYEGAGDMLSPMSLRKRRKAKRPNGLSGLSGQCHCLTDPKHVAGGLTTPDQADLTSGECDRLPGRLQRLLEYELLPLPLDLPDAEMRRKAVPIPYDVIAIRHHTADERLQSDQRLLGLGGQP